MHKIQVRDSNTGHLPMRNPRPAEVCCIAVALKFLLNSCFGEGTVVSSDATIANEAARLTSLILVFIFVVIETDLQQQGGRRTCA